MTTRIVTDANGRKYITTEPLPAKIIDYEAAYYALQKKIGFDRADERNKLATWMIAKGYATGHGDSIEDLLQELDWQIAENWTRGMVNGVEAEREACAKLADLVAREIDDTNGTATYIATAIRART
jgi:hypothetical protein